MQYGFENCESLASDAGDAVYLANRADAIAGKPDSHSGEAVYLANRAEAIAGKPDSHSGEVVYLANRSDAIARSDSHSSAWLP